MKRLFKGALILLLVAPVLFAALAWITLKPSEQNLTLPPGLVAANSAQGGAFLQTAEYKADYEALNSAYVPQKTMSYCGVASSVTVLKALGRESTQWDFFNDATSDVRSRLQVTFGGMTLGQLDGLLSAHGLVTHSLHGDELSLDEFRTIVLKNLATSGDYLLVNYQRKALDQTGSGHISPVAAYNASADLVLVLDTADFKYPYTWVPLERLYDALHDVDSASGRSRGILEVAL